MQERCGRLEQRLANDPAALELIATQTSKNLVYSLGIKMLCLKKLVTTSRSFNYLEIWGSLVGLAVRLDLRIVWTICNKGIQLWKQWIRGAVGG